MQQSTKQQDTLHGQMNAGGTPTGNPPSLTMNPNNEGNEELLERHRIEDSPFWIIGNATDGYFLSLGKHRLTELKPSITDVKEHLKTHTWEIILQLIVAVIETDKEIDREEGK